MLSFAHALSPLCAISLVRLTRLTEREGCLRTRQARAGSLHFHVLFSLQSVVYLPPSDYAASGNFSVNLWQRVHRAAANASMYLFSHQARAPTLQLTEDVWGANQVQPSKCRHVQNKQGISIGCSRARRGADAAVH